MCLVDPDMLLLRPITPLLAEGLAASSRDGKSQSSKKQFELSTTATGAASGGGGGHDQQGSTHRAVARVLAARPLDGLPARVGLGRPAGQHFGIGGVGARAETKAVPGRRGRRSARPTSAATARLARERRRRRRTGSTPGPVYLHT